ncbi:MAG: AmmeMemoRadiSam system protein B [Candidatus Omnitrophica bacterium]|nr:AmmeMemoRadiSam system protein B [Candidatus Omnitrophota bacterium]
MEGVSFAEKRLRVSGIKILIIGFCCWITFNISGYAQEIKEPNVAGTFYPDNPQQLSGMIDGFLDALNPPSKEGQIFALICPHAGYGYSGGAAGFAYKLIKGSPYKTIIVIGPSHYFNFNGISVYPQGFFRTPLGELEVDKDFTKKLLYKDKDVFFEPAAFEKEHSIEVQIPFLQKTLSNFKIVPIVMGNCNFLTCQKLADLLKAAIGSRKDVLVVASSDMYHGYSYEEAGIIDGLTLSYLKDMDVHGLYKGLEEGRMQLCGGYPVVSALILARDLGYDKLNVLKYTNSSEVTGNKNKGIWTVGYGSCAIYREKACMPAGRESNMLNKEQRKKMLMIARSSIQSYLKTGKKPELNETDPELLKEMGAFVTLHERGQLRGCIGNLVGREPLYLTIRDMAVEAATDDPRFPPVTSDEIKDIEIEISALSPLKRIESTDEIKMGIHGVIVRSGSKSGVFLPQVATETGWSKEYFLSELCEGKAGLSRDAWKDKNTEIYIFTAEVFSEKDY